MRPELPGDTSAYGVAARALHTHPRIVPIRVARHAAAAEATPLAAFAPRVVRSGHQTIDGGPLVNPHPPRP